MNLRLGLAILCCALAACGSDGRRSAASVGSPLPIDPFDGNPWMPLIPDTYLVYLGEEDGLPLREEIQVLAPVRWSESQRCVPVQERRFLDGVLTEMSTEWFATDAAANVWKFGEEAWHDLASKPRLADDNWLADEEGKGAVMVMPAAPRAGAAWQVLLPHAEELLLIAATDGRVATPAGDFDDCVEVHENPDDPDHDIILYAPGTGVVEARAANGFKVLTTLQGPR